MSKIWSSLKNLRDRTRASVTIKPRNLLFFTALFLVIFVAILIRLSPLAINNFLIKAFDPWIQYYQANYLSSHSLFEYFNWHDFKSWFPEGIDRGNLRPGLTFTVVIIYQAFNSIGIPISLYDICFYFPAFMGGLTVFAAYLLGKEALDRKCGLIAAFFMAFNTGFMQRTTAGFFDNETIGVFTTLMTFYFFLRTIRTGRITDSVLGGLFLGYLTLSWGGYYFVFYLLPIIVGILILMKKYNTHVLVAYAGIVGTALLIFSLYYNFDYNELFSSLNIGGIYIFLILLIFYHLIYTKRDSFPKFYSGLINLLKWGLIPAVLVLAIIVWINPSIIPFGFGGRIQSILSPLIREGMSLTASVAEHSPSAWSVFYYNTLIPLIVIPLGLFFLFRRGNAADVLLIVFILTLFYFTGSMIRIILLFAPAACLVGAYGLSSILKIFGSFYKQERSTVSRKRRRQLKRMVGKSEIAAVYFIIGFMCFAQIMHGSEIATGSLSSSQISPGGYYHDWENSLTWMKTNFAGDTVVVSWWDYGYWITPIGNMTTVNDNGTVNSTRIGMTGMALMQTNEVYSAKILRILKADYVLVYFGYLFDPLGGDEGKWQWMIRIPNDHYTTYKEWGLEEDNWARNAVFDEAAYVNASSGRVEALWFNSQLVKLMFWGISTDPFTGTSPQTFEEYYRDQIGRRVADDGNPWSTYIPAGGEYESDVFIPAYYSSAGLVKIYKVDYTVLDSSFEIKEPEVFDSGYGTFRLQNTGIKNLTITDVKVNNVSQSFNLGKGFNTNILEAGEDDYVWVDIKSSGKEYNKNDVVRIEVEAQSEAANKKTYVFTNDTSNFFVKESKQGDIQINKENSYVLQLNESSADIYLEVENTGETTVILDKFYADSIINELQVDEYLSGSPILAPGEKATVKVYNYSISFWPIRTEHKIGIITPNEIQDEILLTSQFESYELSIISKNRIISPEAVTAQNSNFRKYIPISLNGTYAYTYNNGTTRIFLKLQNTGQKYLGLDSIYLSQTGSWDEVESIPALIFAPGDIQYFSILAPDGIDINDEIGIKVTGDFNDTTKASDIGYIHTISEDPDLQILEYVEGDRLSFIAANETGQILVKNTGNVPLKLEEIFLNTTTTLNISTDVKFLSGDAFLDLQECALISFNISGFNINVTNQMNVNVSTNTTAMAYHEFSAIVDSDYYNIEIDNVETVAIDPPANSKIRINNIGALNVTIDSIYINGTYIPLVNFSGNTYEIAAGSFVEFTIPTAVLEDILGIIITDGDELEILVRTVQGAEDTYIVVVEE
jgi:dolichyl-diphosphooligosaccharide--protein glycosyltransferase